MKFTLVFIRLFFKSFQTLHTIYHESAACHVGTELMELLGVISGILKTLTNSQSTGNEKDSKTVIMNCKDWVDVVRKLATLQNSYNPSEMRNLALGKKIFV